MDTVTIKVPKLLVDYLIGVCIAEMDFIEAEGDDYSEPMEMYEAWDLVRRQLIEANREQLS
jgi:hypothetical protein